MGGVCGDWVLFVVMVPIIGSSEKAFLIVSSDICGLICLVRPYLP